MSNYINKSCVYNLPEDYEYKLSRDYQNIFNDPFRIIYTLNNEKTNNKTIK